MSWIFYALAGAAVLHVVEEYGFPGGFMNFMRGMAGRFGRFVTVRFSILANGIFIILAILGALVSSRAPLFSLAIAGLCGINGLSHLAGTLRIRRYVPGLATGLVLYLPLAGLAYTGCLRAGLVTPSQAAGTLAAGMLLQLAPLVYLGARYGLAASSRPTGPPSLWWRLLRYARNDIRIKKG